MNELTLMQSFRAERDAEPAEAREAIWRALEARIEAATEESLAFGEAVARTAPRPATVRRRRGLGPVRRRRAVVFVAAALLAAIATSVIVLRSGPTAQPASAAEILHQAASAAAASGEAPTSSVPGPGQFFYREEQILSVHGWIYPLPAKEGNEGLATTGGTMKGPDAYNALMPVTQQWWIGPDGGGRYREVAGTPQPLTPSEEARWKAAGSPLPPPFNIEYQQRYKETAFPDAIALEEGVLDLKSNGFGNYHFPDTSKLPTEAVALREQAEANELEYTGFNHVGGPTPKHLDAEETKEELLNVLQEGFATPQLQAAIFGALAELPGVSVLTDVTDGSGRQGDAVVARVEDGVQWQTVFNPETGEFLGSRGILVDPASSDSYGELPAGTPISERNLLDSGLVDSIAETPAG